MAVKTAPFPPGNTLVILPREPAVGAAGGDTPGGQTRDPQASNVNRNPTMKEHTYSTVLSTKARG